MKQKLYTSDLMVLARDIEQFAPIARIQNIYHLSHHRFLMKFASKEVSGSPFLFWKPGEWIFQTDEPPTERPKLPTTFCQKLRKHLVNKRLKSCRCLNGNRILHFQIGHQDPEEPAHAHLFVEFFGQGNVILTDAEYRVLSFIYPHFYGEQVDQVEKKGTRIRVSEPYFYHPTHDLVSPLEIDAQLYGKDIIQEMNYPEPNSKTLETVLQQITTSSGGYITSKECVPYLYPYLKVSLEKATTFETFSQALAYYLKHRFPKKWRADNGITEGRVQKAEMKKKGQADPTKKTLDYKKKNLLKCHQKSVDKLQHKLTTLQQHIDVFYEYQFAIEHFLQDKTIPIRGVEHISLFQTDDGTKIDVFHDKSYHQNLQHLFQEKKALQLKLDKTEKGLSTALSALERQFKKPRPTSSAGATHTLCLGDKLESTSKRWYQDYHWFFTSHGFLVVCGKNHGQNEEIVKRHCQTHDLYFHSEVAGSGSAILKNTERRQVSPLDLEEAGNFVICMSRAWQSKVADAAYWVYPDQVSKTTQTGEFVQAGSFIIRGTRNRIPNTELVLGIAIHEDPIKKETRLMCGPYRSLANIDKSHKVKVVPGKASRNKTTEKIAKSLHLTTRWKTAIDVLLPQGIQLG